MLCITLRALRRCRTARARHNSLETVAIHRFDQRGKLHGNALRLMNVAAIERSSQITHRTGCDMRDHGNNADRTNRKERQEQTVISRIPS